MQYLRVKNWKEFQHYNDRSPPWIKLHRKVLDDYDMACLQDASKLHLILIWVLASQLDNRIPNDPAWVAKKIGATTKVNLKELIDKGFLIVEHGDSAVLAERSPETEEEREGSFRKAGRQKLSLEELSLSHNAAWLAEKRAMGKYLQHDEDFILEYFKNYCKSKGKTYADPLAGYRNAFEWSSCQPKPNGGGVKTKDDRARAAVLRAAAAGGYAPGQRHGGQTTSGDTAVSGIPRDEDIREGAGEP
jgi:ribosomal protein L19E